MNVKVKTPPPKREGPDWSAIVKRLKRNRGTWYMVHEGGPAGVAVALRQKRIKVMRELDGLEITTRNNNRAAGTNDLYVRISDEEK